MVDWGVPDWRYAAAYERYLVPAPMEWRWQFMRRRPDYRKLWEKWHSIHKNRCAKEEKPFDPDANYLPVDDPNELRLEYEIHVLYNPKKDFSAEELERYYCSKKSLSFLPIHMVLKYAKERFESDGAEVFDDLIRRMEKRDAALLEQGIYGYSFDVSRPLGPQFEDARNYLASVQKYQFGKQITTKPHYDKLLLYLRALDARTCGATYAEIAKVFWPRLEKTPQSARDTFKAACELRDNFPG